MTAVPRWTAAGWSRRPRSGREWRLLRDGRPEPVRRDGPVPACRRCGCKVASEFGLRTGPDGHGGVRLFRKCLRCERRRAAAARDRQRDAWRAYQRAWARRRRARLRLAAFLGEVERSRRVVAG